MTKPPVLGADAHLFVTETHISSLFFTKDRVYKVLKPVANGFLDHRLSTDRVDAAAKEIFLNRRLAPDIYLGDADVIEDGKMVDRMIVMRRLPAERSLTSIIRRGELTEDLIRSIARKIAVFHSEQPPLAAASRNFPGSLDAHRGNWEDSMNDLEEFVGPVLDAGDNDRLNDLARAYLDSHAELFDSRSDHGYIRDGHGDMLADDIFMMSDGPRILDCLAFRDDFRIGDVLSDVAFLAMDLHRLGCPMEARDLLRYYQEFSGERHPSSLAHHYVAYRAHVRAKVACLRWQQGATEFAEIARTYHRLALDQLERAQTRLILVGGGPGTGKTTVADRLADLFGWVVLSSDITRKNLANVEPTDHKIARPDEGIYTSSVTNATYDELLREAAILLEAGECVVLDASWTDAHQRAKATGLAREKGVEIVEFECQVPLEIARERVARRLADGGNPSDATPAIVDHLAAVHDDWGSAVRLNSAQRLRETIEDAAQTIVGKRTETSLPLEFAEEREDAGRVAAEFQDTVVQRLFVAGVQLEIVARSVAGGEDTERIRRVLELLDGVLEDTRMAVASGLV